ncbi:helix-turn-helix domain-containing protein [Burkholderia glumae]|uniref:helix-turn-helix domain-containing protein n=1 Tax=Burkholderia glumae TaxID=337 RepID=UPI00163B563A|nr:helix-turn-helix domain-containing protein [Burkholderia glumae]
MPIQVDLVAIGQRIEGLRGNLSQADFAARLGVDRKTVGTWERGERLPDTRALIGLWGEFEADPAWLLTGKGFAPTTTEDERKLLVLFRSAPLAVKAAAIAALGAGSITDQKRSRTEQVFHAEVGQAVKVEGDLDQRGISFVVGGKDKKRK